METIDMSLCRYLKEDPDPNPEKVRDLIQQGADPFELVGVKPTGLRYSTIGMIAGQPNAVRLFRLLASIIDMRGKLQDPLFSISYFIEDVCCTTNRELFAETIPYLVGDQVIFSLPMDPWYWTEYLKRHTVDLTLLTDARFYEYDVIATALRKDASMEMLRFLANYISINPRKRFTNAYGYLELACVFGSFEAVKWLVEEHGCLVYAHDVDGNPLGPMGEFDVGLIPNLLHVDYAVQDETIRRIRQVSGLTDRLFPLLAAADGYCKETVRSKVTYLLKNGALPDLNRRFFHEDLCEEWYGVPHPLKMATDINGRTRMIVLLELMKQGAVPTVDVKESPYCAFIPQLVRDAINEYMGLGYFFFKHGANDSKVKRQRVDTITLPPELYNTIGSFLLCARHCEFECLSRCLMAIA